jgi:hypothetical protein
MAAFSVLVAKGFCSNLSTWQFVLLGEDRRRCLKKFSYIVGMKTVTYLFENAG